MHRSMARRDSNWYCSGSWICGPGRGPSGRGPGGAVVGMPRTGAVAVVGLCQTAEGTVVITVKRMVGFETI